MIRFKDFLVSENIYQYEGVFKITFYMGNYEYYIYIEESAAPEKSEIPSDFHSLEKVDKFYYLNFDSKKNRSDIKTYYVRDVSAKKSISMLCNLAFLFERAVILHKEIHGPSLYIAAAGRPELNGYYNLLFKSYMCYKGRRLDVCKLEIKADRKEDNVPFYAIR